MAIIDIPLNELQIDFVRSSGPGGQNVNKVSTKAQLRWMVRTSKVFNFWEKERLREKLKTRLNKNDEIIISCDDERLQAQNKDKAIHILQILVTAALRVPKRRVPTKPTYGSKLKRLEIKTKRSNLKQGRVEKLDF